MGTWSADPFGNDTALDWADELDGAKTWKPVQRTLEAALQSAEPLDADLGAEVVAAAYLVAHASGQTEGTDEDLDELEEFLGRAGVPKPSVVELAARALDLATAPTGELYELWAESDSLDEFERVVVRLRSALSGA